MSSSISSDSRIIIVGAGAWGLSTALHLNASGYRNVTVFDRSEAIPSTYSAANDLNKIVRAEYEDLFYADLALVSHASIGAPSSHRSTLKLIASDHRHNMLQ